MILAKSSVIPTLILILTFLYVLAAPLAGQAGLRECIEATVRIRAGNGWGSGSVIAADRGGSIWVLTNAHVAGTRPGKQVEVEFWRSGHKSAGVPGTTVSTWYEQGYFRDIAIVTVKADALGGYMPPVIPLARPGDEVDFRSIVTVGAPGASWPTLMSCHGWRRRADSGDVIYFTPHGGGGRSGSAIFDAAGTRIVGLLAWGYQPDRSKHNRDGNGLDGSYGIAMTYREIWAAFGGQGKVYGDDVMPRGVFRLPLSPVGPAPIARDPRPHWFGHGRDGELIPVPRLHRSTGRDDGVQVIRSDHCVHEVPLSQACAECRASSESQWGKPPGGGQPPQQPGNPGSPFPTLPPGLVEGDQQPREPGANGSQYVTREQLDELIAKLAAQGIDVHGREPRKPTKPQVEDLQQLEQRLTRNRATERSVFGGLLAAAMAAAGLSGWQGVLARRAAMAALANVRRRGRRAEQEPAQQKRRKGRR